MADLEAALRALLAVNAQDRPALAARIIQSARIADKYRKRLGRSHPEFGNGSILSAVQKHPMIPQVRSLGCDHIGALADLLIQLKTDKQDPTQRLPCKKMLDGVSSLPWRHISDNLDP